MIPVEKHLHDMKSVTLTDGVDDAAISVPSAVQGGQVSDGLPSQIVLQKETTPWCCINISWLDFFFFTFLASHEGGSYELTLVLGWSPGVAVRIQQHLGVGVDGHEGLDVAMGLHKVHNGLNLGLRVSPGSTVGLRTGVVAGTRCYRWWQQRKSEKLCVCHICLIYYCKVLFPHFVQVFFNDLKASRMTHAGSKAWYCNIT